MSLNTKTITISTLIIIVAIGISYYQYNANTRGELVLKPYNPVESYQKAVITVNQKEISLAMLLQELKKKGGHLPGRFDKPEQRKHVIDALIQFELLAQEAKKLNYHNDPEIQLAYQKLLVAKFKREQIQTKLSEIIITDGEIKKYYQNRLNRYQEPAMARVAMIFIRKPANLKKTDIDRLTERMDQVKKMAVIQKTKDFGKLPIKYSDDKQSKYKGGALPWLSEKARHFRLEPKIIKSVFQLKAKGDISPVIETENGYYLLKLMDKKAAKTKPLAGVRLQIQADLKSQMKQKWLDAFYHQLKDNADISYNDNLLSNKAIWINQTKTGNDVPKFPAN